jgi:fructokinase
LARIDVVTMGELLIDFVSSTAGISIRNSHEFIKAAGGAPANVAVGVRRFDRSSAFIGKVGNDEFGSFLVDMLTREGVDTRGIRYENQARTALAFVSLGEKGEREFMFYRHPSADMLLDPGEVDLSIIAQSRVFHHGSISLINEPVRSATRAAITAARDAGALVSYDPNLRLSLWKSPHEARKVILSAFHTADLIKLSHDEMSFLTGAATVDEGKSRLRSIAEDHCLIIVTRGKQGCTFVRGETCFDVPGFNVRVVDTTGAGDAFVAGLLVGLITKWEILMPSVCLRQAVRELEEKDWRDILLLANATGALCTRKKGAIPALPTRDETLEFLREHGSTSKADAFGCVCQCHHSEFLSSPRS